MPDLMKRGMDWFASKMQSHTSRSVVYRGVRSGVSVSGALTVGIGMSQLTPINTLGLEPMPADLALSDPSEVDRDYIVKLSDLKTAGLWPPESGDVVDDTNDETGVVKRHEVKSLPNQSPWRWLRGSYNVLARVHTKFLREVATYWLDSFTGTDGALTSHTPDSGPTGAAYESGSGTVSILSNRIVAGSAEAYHYFEPGEVDTVSTIDLNFNVTDSDIDGGFVEMGLAVRCAASGAGKRDGVYCTVKVGYIGLSQDVKELKIVRRQGGSDITDAILELPEDLALTPNYKLIVVNKPDKIILTLADSTGAVSIASLDSESSLLNSNTVQAVYFNHVLLDTTDPWMDNLLVEAA